METPCKLFENPQGSQRSQQQQSARPQWKQRWSAIALGELCSPRALTFAAPTVAARSAAAVSADFPADF